jgi:hypothetical protein
MRENLRVDRSYLQLITDQSKAPRHGDVQAIEALVTEEVAKRCWTIMNRYFEFKKRGGSPLPLSEYPLLTDQQSLGRA